MACAPTRFDQSTYVVIAFGRIAWTNIDNLSAREYALDGSDRLERHVRDYGRNVVRRDPRDSLTVKLAHALGRGFLVADSNTKARAGILPELIGIVRLSSVHEHLDCLRIAAARRGAVQLDVSNRSGIDPPIE